MLRRNNSMTNETNITANVKSNTTEFTAAMVFWVLSSAMANCTFSDWFCFSIDCNFACTALDTSTALASPCFFKSMPIPFLPLYLFTEVISLMPSVTVATSFTYTGLPGTGMPICTFLIPSTSENFPVSLTELLISFVCTFPVGMSTPLRLMASETCVNEMPYNFNFSWSTFTWISFSSPPNSVISATPFICCNCGK